jgi:HEAT repeat protein
MTRIAQLLNIRSGEGRLTVLLVALMLVTALGSSVGATAVETLFFARFGVENLPLIFMSQGITTMVITLAVTALLGRLPRSLIFAALPVALGLVLVGERFLIGQAWFYPIMWLLKEVTNSLLGLYVWGVASMSCDTRQAKRLFPIINAGRIFGSVLGGLATGFLVNRLGTENVLLVWAATFVLAFVLTRLLMPVASNASQPVQTRKRKTRQKRAPGFIDEMQQGWRFVRTSPLMKWVSLAAILFSVLYFSLALPFSKAVTQQFPSEETLAGFLGTFNALNTAAAFLASLFFANRFYTRFGVITAVLALPIIYVLGFGAMALAPTFQILVAYKFIQMVWMAGIADSAYQAMFNAVPSHRRDQVRAFISGVPEQAGTFIAGLILVIGEQALDSRQLYLIGLGTGLACSWVIWKAARAYSGALVTALRAGQPTIFLSQDSFGNAHPDSAALSVVLDGLKSPDAKTRRAAVEILGSISGSQAAGSLIQALTDSDSDVRAAALRALAAAQANTAVPHVLLGLNDPEPVVRLQAVETLRQIANQSAGIEANLEPLLNDPDSGIRARTAVALLQRSTHEPARALLRSMAILGTTVERVTALTALGDGGDAEALALVEMELEDTAAPVPVRAAAARALAARGRTAIPALINALASNDRLVRDAAAVSLAQLGAPAFDATLEALFQPDTAHGAIHALEILPGNGAAVRVREFARQQVERAAYYHELYRNLLPSAVNPNEKLKLLLDSLRDRARYYGLHALRAVNLLGDRQSLLVVMDNLRNHDPAQRANALETLESVQEAVIVKPILGVWDESELAPARTARDLSDALRTLLHEQDAWLRVCAVLAAGTGNLPDLAPTLAHLSQTDNDPLVRQEAQAALNGARMETLANLSLMERLLFLRRVPLFADLSPADLKQVAAIANEESFEAGDVIAEQGEIGSEMFVIVSGEVGVWVQADGKPEAQVALRKAGDYVGEMAIISQEPRIASLIAADSVKTLCIDRSSFESLLRERPEVSLAVMRTLCVRLKELSR